MTNMAKLLSPLKIGAMTVKNRMIMPPISTNLASDTGAVTRPMIDFYVERARNGVGMVVVEAASVSPLCEHNGTYPRIHGDQLISSWFALSDALHMQGVKAAMEIAHAGAEASGSYRVSASDVSSAGGGVRPLSETDIARIQAQFASAAARAKKACFDAVTIHAAHGELIGQFLSPIYNRRTDSYGGCLENRMRFLLETVAQCRAAVGATPLIVRISADERIEGGYGVEEAIDIARALEHAGVDAIDLSCGVPASFVLCTKPYNMDDTEAFLAPIARKIKQTVGMPVICACGMRNPDVIARVVEERSADFVAIGRALVADPAFCRKIIEGRARDIRACLGCQQCYSALFGGRGIRCSINPLAGRESIWQEQPPPAARRKTILVVGAGPSGLEAALTAARRGHDVTLIDRAGALGGGMRIAALPPRKERVSQLIAWYERQLRRAGVKVVLGRAYKNALAQSLGAQAVVFATGAGYRRVIPGCEAPWVFTVAEVLADPGLAGPRVVIVGGGISGCEAAEVLTDAGMELHFTQVKSVRGGGVDYEVLRGGAPSPRSVTVVEMTDALCDDAPADVRMIQKIRLDALGVRAMVETKVERIVRGAIVVRGTRDAAEQTVPADTVVLAGGMVSAVPAETPADCEVFRVGDCEKPGRIQDAIFAGHAVGRLL